MTPDQIIQLAREAGGETDWQTKQSRSDPELSDHDFVFTIEDLTRLVELARADKQEQCAKVCREVSAASGGDKYDMFGNDLAEQCEAAIRALKD